MWTRLGHLVIDSVESGGARWVRGAGEPSAWKDVPDRPEADGDGVSDKLQQVHL